jgi:four helix bundle protein
MDQEALKERCKALALRVMSVVGHLPQTIPGKVIADQLMRSASSVAANYRAACRARSRAEFVSKLSIVVEEADETVLWLELIMDGGLLPAERIRDLLAETNEITAIMVASRKTASS